MTEVFVGIGSNVQPEKNIRSAVQQLRARFGALHVSPVYRNPAVGFEGDDFFNLVAGFSTTLGFDAVHDSLERIEFAHGRVRGGPRYAPRTLDIDMLLYGDLVRDAAPVLPRKDLLRYAFVLKPMTDIAPERRHPQTGRSFAEHWAAFDAASQPLALVTLTGL
ncbi:MAG TPA: 2-amino-4-hydroxy-6-hydroxymethyldihydropteridine diphosphokinase [Gammaproteobacteria bacterium]|nr:2-amino-4-hydroxy-6-hydroxymethyldihydropteridine diphosphokinase [Gammaproteobacteria bacterium]